MYTPLLSLTINKCSVTVDPTLIIVGFDSIAASDHHQNALSHCGIYETFVALTIDQNQFVQ